MMGAAGYRRRIYPRVAPIIVRNFCRTPDMRICGTDPYSARFTYNGQHLPLSRVDGALGRPTILDTMVTRATHGRDQRAEQTMTFVYDPNGYLTNIVGAVTNATTSLTYDTYGRVQTMTDSEGYTLAFEYDALDRLAGVSIPGRDLHADRLQQARPGLEPGSARSVVNPHLQSAKTDDRPGRCSRTGDGL